MLMAQCSESGFEFLDAADEEALEYIRGCHMNRRDGDAPYVQCTDRVHLGYIVIRERTRILMNHICNGLRLQ